MRTHLVRQAQIFSGQFSVNYCSILKINMCVSVCVMYNNLLGYDHSLVIQSIEISSYLKHLRADTRQCTAHSYKCTIFGCPLACSLVCTLLKHIDDDDQSNINDISQIVACSAKENENRNSEWKKKERERKGEVNRGVVPQAHFSIVWCYCHFKEWERPMHWLFQIFICHHFSATQ